MPGPLKVCVLGGGSGAHVMACLAASKPETEVNVLTLYKDEAEQWNKALEGGPMTVHYVNEEGRFSEVKAAPAKVSKDPAEVVPDSDLVVLVVPAEHHAVYLKAVAPHLHDRSCFIGLPGKPGFEFQYKTILGERADIITAMSFEALPWACKVVEYGKFVEVYGTNKQIKGSLLRGKAIPKKPALMNLQMLLGFEPMLMQAKHYLEVLFTSYCFFDPVMIYGRWRKWDEKPVNHENSLFYQCINEETAELLQKCSMEITDVAHAITAKHPSLDLTQTPDIFNWYLHFYKGQIEDTSSLQNAIQTTTFDKNRTHAVTKLNTRFKPDFKASTLADDLPMGLVVLKGVAEILEVPIPLCDTALMWGQEKVGAEYLVDGKLTGKDMKSTRCPQVYGLTSLEDLLKGSKVTDESQ